MPKLQQKLRLKLQQKKLLLLHLLLTNRLRLLRVNLPKRRHLLLRQTVRKCLTDCALVVTVPIRPFRIRRV